MPDVLKIIDERLVKERPLFLVYVGGHDNFPAEKTWKDFFNTYNFLTPIIDHLVKNKIKKPSFLWLGGNTNGPLKLVQYSKNQGSRKAFDYIQGLAVYDFFPMTKDVYSFDGTHFGSTLNGMKVKMLMKLLRYNSFEVR